MEPGIRTLDDIDAAEATVGVRVDINSPLEPEDGANGREPGLADDARLRAHVETLSELANRGARVAVLAHQGRPGGEEFATLRPHARRLDDLLAAPVGYVDGTFCSAARDRLRATDLGGVLVLENTRFYSEEYIEFDPPVAARTHLVERLSEVLDAYVNDAFAAAHRSQPSLVGFPERLPGFAGRLMERELEVLGDIASTDRPRVYVLGGAKVDDSVGVAADVLEKGLADSVLTAGVVGNAFLQAGGTDLGPETAAVTDYHAGEETLGRAARLLERYPDRIDTPRDVVVRRDGERTVVPVEALPAEKQACDIGPATVEAYGEVLAEAGTAVLNGPAGMYEEPAFADGTRELFRAARAAGYTIVGGGDTAAALRSFGLEGFDHVSTGGGAALALLTGGSLPAVEALRR
jgi:phosphoglycerate kinase